MVPNWVNDQSTKLTDREVRNIYLAEAEKRQHGEDRGSQGKYQQVFANPIPLQPGMHQEGH